jgi:hypothetical protein
MVTDNSEEISVSIFKVEPQVFYIEYNFNIIILHLPRSPASSASLNLVSSEFGTRKVIAKYCQVCYMCTVVKGPGGGSCEHGKEFYGSYYGLRNFCTSYSGRDHLMQHVISLISG